MVQKCVQCHTWQTFSQCDNQSHNDCHNVTLHYNLFNVVMRVYKLGVQY